jgi:predicted  nucleic acid-binding Zn-ribbon protein
MPSQASLLYGLQKVDLELGRHRARLKEIEAKLSGDETVARAQQELDAAQTALKPWQTRARDLDLEIKALVQKMKASEDDLYGGRIRSPKALQELQDEIASLKRHQSALEDNLLEAMMEVEENQGQVSGSQQALADARAALASQQTDLVDEGARLETEVMELEAERKQKAAGIEAASLAAYDKLRPRYKGQPVALLLPSGCALCGVEQTSMNGQAVRNGRTLAYCESCGRILATGA